MKQSMLAVLVVGFLAADSPEGDLKQFQGTWVLVGGGDSPDSAESKEGARKADARLVVEGEKFTTTSAEMVTYKGTIKLDPTKTPKEYDSTYTDGRHLKGIYELDGDNLRLCFAASGRDRPTAFKAKQGDQIYLLVYKRDTNKP